AASIRNPSAVRRASLNTRNRGLHCHNRVVRAVVQRVSRAEIRVGGAVVAEIGGGLAVLLGVARDDRVAMAAQLAGKVARLRVFENEEGRFDPSLLDLGGAALVVSQFTLIANTS